MPLPLRFSLFLMVFTVVNAVEIIPPSPYMSSPPPVEADTSVIDPGRKPRILTVEPGIQEQWYADWNLTTDHPLTGPLELSAPRLGRPTFRVAFNDHGWPTELTYFDTKGGPRWTKLFRYPAKFPAGPGDVDFVASWFSSKGTSISMSKIDETYNATVWKKGLRKYDVSDLLGEPLLVEIPEVAGTGPAEVWRYLVNGKEVVFSFDKDNRLLSLPVVTEPKVEPVKATAVQPVATVPPIDSAAKVVKKKKKAKN